MRYLTIILTDLDKSMYIYRPSGTLGIGTQLNIRPNKQIIIDKYLILNLLTSTYLSVNRYLYLLLNYRYIIQQVPNVDTQVRHNRYLPYSHQNNRNSLSQRVCCISLNHQNVRYLLSKLLSNIITKRALLGIRTTTGIQEI